MAVLYSMPETSIALRDRVIVALDCDSLDKAEHLVRLLRDKTRFFKVGLQLFLAQGHRVLDMLRHHDCRIMLDLKLHDIPQTVRLALEALAGRQLDFVTVHGEFPVIAAAAEAEIDFGVLAVTVLTSLSQDDLARSGITLSVDELVEVRARAAIAAGLTGVVASAREAAFLRTQLGNDPQLPSPFTIVTPGIRPAGGNVGDQKRVCTPADAIRRGADHLVIGRPITHAPDPVCALVDILEEIKTEHNEKAS
ncbi:orotidine-5'-phosphate decarboxylase [Desulfovibrio inopinatus]|uniref:orotidine-5'-phosphate decarboxylase n=1 Tax=Desulfovibrio inopinatus TaxID=102109 RepID=UPI0004166B29|nr:orotidine-5'-phosphate decarboxylase [Desulfovibrio inopinatus]